MKLSWLLTFFLPVLIFGFMGCDSLYHKSISEGVIEFEITYPETDAGDLMASLLPSEMTLKFKDNKTIGELSSMGIFKTSLIAYPDSKKVAQLVKIMTKKYVLMLDSTEVKDLYSELPEMTIHFVDETKEIAGYKCKKAIITFKNNIKDEFSVYYTNDIEIKNSNWYTPFYEIDGVLLEYQVRKYNIEMRLTATRVTNSTVDDSEFEIPPDYNKITQEEMNQIFEGFQDI